MTQALRNEVNSAFKDSFMKPEVFQSEYVEIDGEHGTIFIPISDISVSLDAGEESEYEDLSQDDMESVAQAYQNHFAGNAEPYSVAVRSGFMYRLSALGYMDCTEYSASDSEEEALQELLAIVD